MADREKESWHLDKKVPIALIAALLVQAGSIIWWARGIEAAVDGQRQRIVALETGASEVGKAMNDIKVDVARIDERSKGQTSLLQDIKSALRP